MAVKRVYLVVAYDGTNYCGWQYQNNGPTIEGELIRALRSLLKEEVEIIGASRTDSGVHAMGNIAVFDTETRIPPEKIAIAVNHYLPEDIRVQSSKEVSPDFHPRHCGSIKTYEYTILNTDIPIPVRQRYVYHLRYALDIEAMREAARILVGTHDFSAFCSAGSQVQSKVRTICDIEWEERPAGLGNGGREIILRIRGTGFLYNMVRIIAGTLLEVGMGRRGISSVQEALETGERSKAGPTAPAQGLVLVGILYDNPIQSER